MEAQELKQSQVSEQTERLGKLIESLRVDVEKLESKLGNVLSNYGGNTCDTVEKKDRELVPLARDIKVSADIVENMNERIRTIYERLEN